MTRSRRRRRYTLGKRADARDATRRRVVEATMACHLERGVLATTIRDIAARAGVSAGTVLNHFPRMPELVQACGALTAATWPFPGEEVLAGHAAVEDRVRALTTALFRAWDTPIAPIFPRLQLERAEVPALDAWFSDVEARHRALMLATLPAGASHGHRALAYALTSFPTWRTLTSEGLTTEEAAAQAASAVLTILGRPQDATRAAVRAHEEPPHADADRGNR
jgi:AcrR family transcriptional regulator